MSDKTLLATIVIPRYVRKVLTSNARRATYYEEGEKLPKKYQDGIAKGKYFWVMDRKRKKVLLTDGSGELVIKNPRVAGQPKYKLIAGNDLHSLRMKDFERSKIIKAIKAQMIAEVEKLEPIAEHHFPIRILMEVHNTVVDAETNTLSWDVDNHALFYAKTFPDVLSGCPTYNKGESMTYISKRIIPNDNILYITQPPVPLFVPVEDAEDRKFVFKIFSDNREIIKTNKHYGREQN